MARELNFQISANIERDFFSKIYKIAGATLQQRAFRNTAEHICFGRNAVDIKFKGQPNFMG
jgi:hypothetical protein